MGSDSSKIADAIAKNAKASEEERERDRQVRMRKVAFSYSLSRWYLMTASP